MVRQTPNCNGTPNGGVGGTPNLSGSCNAPLVYCIHGNKFGVTKCCESLDIPREESKAALRKNLSRERLEVCMFCQKIFHISAPGSQFCQK